MAKDGTVGKCSHVSAGTKNSRSRDQLALAHMFTVLLICSQKRIFLQVRLAVTWRSGHFPGGLVTSQDHLGISQSFFFHCGDLTPQCNCTTYLFSVAHQSPSLIFKAGLILVFQYSFQVLVPHYKQKVRLKVVWWPLLALKLYDKLLDL